MKQNVTFENIYEQNKRRIHFHIHQLNIQDPHQDFFQIGLTSLWEAYQTYQPDKGPMSTYFNCIIRNRLIDKLRKQSRYHSTIKKYLSLLNTDQPFIDLSTNTQINPTLHKELKTHLSKKQWDWLYYCVIEGMTHKELANLKNTTTDAVKSWSRQARKKLNTPYIKKVIENHCNSCLV